MAEILQPLLARMAARQPLTSEEWDSAFAILMAGEASTVHATAFLSLVPALGSGKVEMAAGVRALMRHAIKIEAPVGAIDIVGTGGDGHDTLNISTAAAFVVSACGVPVAKHGNRASSSRSGAADVLESLGANLSLDPHTAQRCLEETGIVFLFAQSHHPAMKHVASLRRELGFRTIFNLLGPLANPAGVKRHLIGVYDKALLVPVAETLAALGSEAAWIVHGADGMDEITTTGPSEIAILEKGSVSRHSVTPEEFGLHRARLNDLKGGDAAHNANAIATLLEGGRGAFRDIVVLNAAAALVVAGKVLDIRPGLIMANEAIETGRARNCLGAYIRATRTL